MFAQVWSDFVGAGFSSEHLQSFNMGTIEEDFRVERITKENWYRVSFWMLVNWIRGLERPNGVFLSWSQRQAYRLERPFPIGKFHGYNFFRLGRCEPSILWDCSVDDFLSSLPFCEPPYDVIVFNESRSRLRDLSNERDVHVMLTKLSKQWRMPASEAVVLVHWFRLLSQHPWQANHRNLDVMRERSKWWHPALPFKFVCIKEICHGAHVLQSTRSALQSTSMIHYEDSMTQHIFVTSTFSDLAKRDNDYVSITNCTRVVLKPGKNVICSGVWFCPSGSSVSVWLLLPEEVDNEFLLVPQKSLNRYEKNASIKFDVWNFSPDVITVPSFYFYLRLVAVEQDWLEMTSAVEINICSSASRPLLPPS